MSGEKVLGEFWDRLEKWKIDCANEETHKLVIFFKSIMKAKYFGLNMDPKICQEITRTCELLNKHDAGTLKNQEGIKEKLSMTQSFTTLEEYKKCRQEIEDLMQKEEIAR
jgi:hypothetical protein